MSKDIPELYTEIGTRIHAARLANQKSIIQLHCETGIYTRTLLKIEEGKRIITAAELTVIARCLHVPSDTILGLK